MRPATNWPSGVGPRVCQAMRRSGWLRRVRSLTIRKDSQSDGLFRLPEVWRLLRSNAAPRLLRLSCHEFATPRFVAALAGYVTESMQRPPNMMLSVAVWESEVRARLAAMAADQGRDDADREAARSFLPFLGGDHPGAATDVPRSRVEQGPPPTYDLSDETNTP